MAQISIFLNRTYVPHLLPYAFLGILTRIHISLQAKDALCGKIDNYIRDRIIIADQVIQETAMKKIHDGDVVLTYAR